MLSNRWAVLAVLCATRIWMGFQFQSISPVAPLLVENLGIGYARVGLLIGLYMFPGIFIAIPGAMLGAKLGERQVVMMGLALMGLGGLLMVHGGTFWAAAAGRLLSGAGAVAVNVQMMKIVTDWFAGRELATAMSVLLTTWPLGIALALATLGGVGERFGWQVAALVPVMGSAAALVFFAALYRGGPVAPGAGEGPSGRVPAGGGTSPFAFRRDEFLISSAAGWVWMVYNAGFIIIVSFAPVYLTVLGASLGEAGSISSLIMWVMIFSIPFGGFLADRLGRPHLMIVAGCVATALAVASLGLLPGSALAFALIGIVMGLPAGSIMSLPAEALPPERRGVGMGIYFTWYYLGMAGFPPLAGVIKDAAGAGTTLHFGALLVLLTVAALLGFRLVRRAQQRRQSSAGVAA